VKLHQASLKTPTQSKQTEMTKTQRKTLRDGPSIQPRVTHAAQAARTGDMYQKGLNQAVF
jgi:hypothetical protein